MAGSLTGPSLHLATLVWGESFCFATLFWYGNTPVRAEIMERNHGSQNQPAKEILPSHAQTDGLA